MFQSMFQLDLGINDVSDDDCSAIRYVCECVSRRAGFMVSAGITALLKKMDYKDVVVAIDGSVFRLKSNLYLPRYRLDSSNLGTYSLSSHLMGVPITY